MSIGQSTSVLSSRSTKRHCASGRSVWTTLKTMPVSTRTLAVTHRTAVASTSLTRIVSAAPHLVSTRCQRWTLLGATVAKVRQAALATATRRRLNSAPVGDAAHFVPTKHCSPRRLDKSSPSAKQCPVARGIVYNCRHRCERRNSTAPTCVHRPSLSAAIQMSFAFRQHAALRARRPAVRWKSALLCVHCVKQRLLCCVEVIVNFLTGAWHHTDCTQKNCRRSLVSTRSASIASCRKKSMSAVRFSCTTDVGNGK